MNLPSVLVRAGDHLNPARYGLNIEVSKLSFLEDSVAIRYLGLSLRHAERTNPMYLIRPLRHDDLRLVEDGLRSGGMPDKHRRRLELQNDGSCTYLFAWQGHAPVGHLLLTWTGPDQEPMKSVLPDCPEVGALFVKEDMRSRGIGGCLLENAEHLVISRGVHHIGLAVGIDNKKAQRLYERRGYVDAGFPQFIVSWTYLDKDGREQSESEECIYLTKRLGD